MKFNKYFSIKNHQNILRSAKRFKYQYHLIITFQNKHNKKSIINKIIKQLPTNSQFAGWICGTIRKFKKNENNHNRKIHLHAVIFSNTEILESALEIKNLDLDLKLVKIYSKVQHILNYIHNGHHILKLNIYKKRYKKRITLYNTNTNTNIVQISPLRAMFRSLRTFSGIKYEVP